MLGVYGLVAYREESVSKAVSWIPSDCTKLFRSCNYPAVILRFLTSCIV